jgi:hypothetical protein
MVAPDHLAVPRAVAAADIATLVTPVVASHLIATDIAAPNVSAVIRLFDPPAPIIVPLRACRR